MYKKEICLSSYLAFQYIEKQDMDIYDGFKHKNKSLSYDSKLNLTNVDEFDISIQNIFDSFKEEKLGIVLFGDKESAILASYMGGCDAYTFRILDNESQQEELKRVEYYSHCHGLKLHYVDINWETVTNYLPIIMKYNKTPICSIEPQLFQAAIQAKLDGVTRLIIGGCRDLILGNTDNFISNDWIKDKFNKRYIFLDPTLVLKEPVDMSYLFKQYENNGKTDFLNFVDDIISYVSLSSCNSAFAAADMPYTNPYAFFRNENPLDLNRVENGVSEYLLCELMKKKYPDIPVTHKVQSPHLTGTYLKDWQGPKRPEFRRNLDMSSFTPNQKWQMYCLEQFLNMYEPITIGYTTGVYDLFHIGHLNLLRKAKSQCDYLIVGVSTDELVSYKHKHAVIPFEERKEIVSAIKYVDEVVTQENMDKMQAWDKYHFDVMFVGDDWKGTDKWNKIEDELKKVGANVVYFPYTKGTSSTLINETLNNLRKDN